MPSPTTALQLIRDGLSLTNAVGADQTLTADETAEGLRAFNDVLEIFSTRNLAVYGSVNQSLNTVIGQSVYTVGTGGDWNVDRPVRISDDGYSVVNTVSFPLVSMTQDEYNAIAFKGQTQDFPTRYLYVNDFPLGRLTVFPVPSAVTPLTFSVDRILTSVASAGTTISFPPGYAMVFVYKLAIMLAPRFGKKISSYPEIVQIANDSFADICRANKKTRLMSYGPDFGTNGSFGTPYSRFIAGY
jgi:hypothetical protein